MNRQPLNLLIRIHKITISHSVACIEIYGVSCTVKRPSVNAEIFSTINLHKPHTKRTLQIWNYTGNVDFVHKFMIEICFMKFCYLVSNSVRCHDKLIDISNRLFHHIDKHCNSNAQTLYEICQANKALKPISYWRPLALTACILIFRYKNRNWNWKRQTKHQKLLPLE